MSKRVIYLLYAVSPIIPICIYLTSTGWSADLYSLSVALGICAFVLACNQLILASKPAFIVAALGQKDLRRLHSIIPAAIIVIAIVHRFLKGASGFNLESPKAELGAMGLIIMVLLSIFAFFLIASIGGKLGDKLKVFRANLAKKQGINYKGSRAIHAVTAIVVPVLGIHLLLASSSAFSRNALGAVWLIAYALFSLYLFMLYRKSGRSPAKESK